MEKTKGIYMKGQRQLLFCEGFGGFTAAALGPGLAEWLLVALLRAPRPGVFTLLPETSLPARLLGAAGAAGLGASAGRWQQAARGFLSRSLPVRTTWCLGLAVCSRSHGSSPDLSSAWPLWAAQAGFAGDAAGHDPGAGWTLVLQEFERLTLPPSKI